jgi:hypothetical protein
LSLNAILEIIFGSNQKKSAQKSKNMVNGDHPYDIRRDLYCNCDLSDRCIDYNRSVVETVV